MTYDFKLGMYSLKLALTCRNMIEWNDCNVIYCQWIEFWYIKWKVWFKFTKWIIVRMSFIVHKKQVLSYYKQSLMFWSPYKKPDTYLPRAARRNSVLSGWPRCMRATLVMSLLREHFRMACRRLCGAISIVMALWGICCDASSKYTAFSRLLVWYSADEYRTAGKL